MRRSAFLFLTVLLAVSVTLRAQQKPAPPATSPTSGPRMEFLDEVSFYEQRFIRLADAIPAEKYGWRPGEGVRSIGEVYMHVAAANYNFARMLGMPIPASVDTKALLASANDKTKVVQALKDSFAHFRGAILAIKDAELDKEIKTPRGESTIRGAFFLITGHFGEHLGQSISYARMVGIVPPWTEERQHQEAAKPKSSSLNVPPKEPSVKVTGIGGVFFRAHEPKALAEWYRANFGIDERAWQQQAGPTAFTPFKEDTKYFGNPSKQWMLNFRVADLDAMVAQLKAAGIDVTVDPENYPYGRFARTHDPEGNPIELWQPMDPK